MLVEARNAGSDGGRRIARRAIRACRSRRRAPCCAWPTPTRSACSVTPGQVLHPLKSMSMVLGVGIDLPAGPLVALRRLPLGAAAAGCRGRDRGADHALSRAMTTSKPAAQAFTLHFPQFDRDITGHAGETIYPIRAPQRRAHHRRLRRPRHLRHLPGADRRRRDSTTPARHARRQRKTAALGARLPGHAANPTARWRLPRARWRRWCGPKSTPAKPSRCCRSMRPWSAATSAFRKPRSPISSPTSTA